MGMGGLRAILYEIGWQFTVLACVHGVTVVARRGTDSWRGPAAKARNYDCGYQQNDIFGVLRVRITHRNILPVNVACVFALQGKRRIRGMANPASSSSLVIGAAIIPMTCGTVLITALVYIMTLPTFVQGSPIPSTSGSRKR